MEIYSHWIENPAGVEGLKKAYNVPDDVRVRRASPLEYASRSYLDGWMPFPLIAVIVGGVRFPLDPLLRTCLSVWSLNPCQLSPNGYKIIMGTVVLNRHLGISLGVHDLEDVYDICKSGEGFYYLQTKPHRTGFVGDLEDLNKCAGDDLLCVSGNCEFSKNADEAYMVPRRPGAVPRSLLFMDDKETSIVEKMTLAKDTEQGTCSILENEKWSDLPIDVLMLITQRLSLVDHLRMTATCKSWQRATLSTWSPQTPFLLFIEDRKAKFFDPLLKKVYVARIPELLDAKFHYSKDAWLLLSRKKLSELFFFNPLTNEKINIPNIELFFNYLTDENINTHHRTIVKKGAFVLTFSSSPTSQDCVVFLILRETSHYTGDGSAYDRVNIYTYCHSDRTWKRFRSIPRGSMQDLFEEFFEGQLAYNSPVYLDGDLYYLSTKGTLGVFFRNGTLYVGYPTGLCSGKHDCYLVESHGRLLSIFCRRNKIHFFQFDRHKWKWIKIKSVEDNVLFLDRLTSLSTTAVGGQKNRIYFSAFKRCCNDPVFFSLQTKKFSREISKCKEHVRRIWVDPKGFELAYGTKSRENPLIVLGKAKEGCN